MKRWLMAFIVTLLVGGYSLGGLPLTAQGAGATSESELKAAVKYINEIRQAAGASQIEYDPYLSLAARQHAEYLVKNRRGNMAYQYSESDTNKGFTGKSSTDRAIAAGFITDGYVYELILDATVKQPDLRDVVDRFIHSTDDRAKLLYPGASKIGIGIHEDIVVFDVSYARNDKSQQPILYPYDGQNNVEVEFIRNLDPWTVFNVYRTGYMISFQPVVEQGIEYEEELPATITDSKGQEIPFIQESSFAYDSFYLFPLERLDYHETYTVSIDYNGNNTMWSFTTMDEPEVFEYPDYEIHNSTLSTYVPESIKYDANEAQLYSYVFSEGLALSIKYGQFGYIDENGREAIPYNYGRGRNFSEGLAAVYDENTRQWGYIDKEGKTVIPFIYQNAEPFSEGLGAVRNASGKWGFINKSGKTVIPFNYDNVELFAYGTAVAVKKGKAGIIDTTGATVVPFKYMAESGNGYKYPSDSPFVDLYIDANKLPKYFSKVEKKILEFKGISYVAPVKGEDKLLYAYQSGKSGIMDKVGIINLKGKIIAPFEYDVISDFSEGLASVGKRDSKGNVKYGYMNKSGKVVIPIVYDKVYSFSEGIAAVGKNHSFNVWNYSLIDNKGKVIKKNLIYTDLSLDGNGKILASKWIYDKNGTVKEKLYGVLDSKGNVIVPVKYTDYEIYYDRDGKAVWKLK